MHHLNQIQLIPNIVVDELSDGDQNKRHVTHSKFTEVITIDFCRIATLR